MNIKLCWCIAIVLQIMNRIIVILILYFLLILPITILYFASNLKCNVSVWFWGFTFKMGVVFRQLCNNYLGFRGLWWVFFGLLGRMPSQRFAKRVFIIFRRSCSIGGCKWTDWLFLAKGHIYVSQLFCDWLVLMVMHKHFLFWILIMFVQLYL